MKEDVQAALAGRPLPPVNAAFVKAWEVPPQ